MNEKKIWESQVSKCETISYKISKKYDLTISGLGIWGEIHAHFLSHVISSLYYYCSFFCVNFDQFHA